MNRPTFDAYLQAYNAGDFASVANYYTSDVVFESFGRTHTGPEVVAFLKQLHQGVKDTITPVTVQIKGDRIVMEADTSVLALVDQPHLPIGAMKAGERRTVKMYASYETAENKIRRIYIAGQPARP